MDIAAIQDPPLAATSHIGKWEGYTFLFGSGAPPLVAIAIKETIKFRPLELGCTRVVGLVTRSSGFECAFLSAYLRHSTGEGHLELSRALGIAQGCAHGIILCTDCNGHSPLWGPASISLNAVGEIVENILLEEI